MGILNRYQIYLDPKEVETFDDMAKLIGVSRTRIIRDVLDRVSNEYRKLINVVKKVSWKKNPLLKMAGIIKKTDASKILSQNVDEIYSED